MPRRLRHRNSSRPPRFSKRALFGAALACLIFAAVALLYSNGSPPSRAPPAPSFTPTEPLAFSSIELNASDGTRLSASYLPSSLANDSVGVVFLHMLGSEKSSWRDFQALVPHSSIAVDLRGHGNSEGNLAAFAQEDFSKFVFDAKAAVDYLAAKGCSRFYVAGASIGANAALALAVNDARVEKIALLSPGLDYRGLKADWLPRNFAGESFYAAAESDEYCAASTKELYSQAVGNKELVMLQGNAHGTGMLFDAEFSAKLLAFLK